MGFFDFGSNGFNIDDLVQLVTFVLVVLLPAAMILYRKSIYAWAVRRRAIKAERYANKIQDGVRPLLDEIMTTLRAEITMATKQIHPNANGGKSLNDLHSKVDMVLGQQGLIMSAQEQTAQDVRTAKERLDDHLAYHIATAPAR